jgi:UrcA family protein
VRSVKVSYADLNLSTLAGATTLYRRIERAARTVCGPESSLREIQRYRDWKNCYESAVSNAVARVNSPLLTAVHGSSLVTHLFPCKHTASQRLHGPIESLPSLSIDSRFE